MQSIDNSDSGVKLCCQQSSNPRPPVAFRHAPSSDSRSNPRYAFRKRRRDPSNTARCIEADSVAPAPPDYKSGPRVNGLARETSISVKARNACPVTSKRNHLRRSACTAARHIRAALESAIAALRFHVSTRSHECRRQNRSTESALVRRIQRSFAPSISHNITRASDTNVARPATNDSTRRQEKTL